jgi:hypothetical protein
VKQSNQFRVEASGVYVRAGLPVQTSSFINR